MTAMIRATGLACRRGDRMLWCGLDLAIDAGAAIHITGANGTGKSSLLRVLAGLLPIAAGGVDRGCRIALLDETLALDPEVAVRRALGFWARINQRGEGPTIAPNVTEALNALSIAHLADVPVRILSTGQRKKVLLMRALFSPADVLILDEVLSGIDAASRAQIEGVLNEFPDKILIVISHETIAKRFVQ